MLTRRAMLRKAAALAASPLAYGLVPVASKEAARGRGKHITFLDDGGFEAGAWGWQTTEGAAIDTAVSHTGRASMRIEVQHPTPKTQHPTPVPAAGAYARFLVLNPLPGAQYTLSGWVKTKGVKANFPGGGAFWAASQFEFQGRPADRTDEGHIEERHFGNLVGDTDWQPFKQTLTCRDIVAWMEITVGIYRGSGVAWFDDLTLVEDDRPAALADVVEPAVAAQWAHAAVLAARTGHRPRAAILRDRLPVRGTASDPVRLAKLLGESYQTAFVTAAELGQPETFSRRLYDLLVLPYGESFPVRATQALRDFLSQGGDLFTTGGYAFQSPLVDQAGAWSFDDELQWKQPGKNLLPENGEGWKRTSPATCLRQGEDFKVTLPAGALGQSAWWQLPIPMRGIARRFYFEARIRAENIDAAQGGCGFVALEQLHANGYPVYATPAELKQVTGTGEWIMVREIVTLSPEARSLRVRFGLKQATGTLHLAGLKLEDRGIEPRINTAKGFPQDDLRILPEQIGVFDPDYRLRRVAYLETPGKQRIEGAFTGYAAAGVLGANHSRWTPLLNAYDRYGRLRGAAGALMHNYNGVYARGSWAFFGVDNQDLFAAGKLDALVRNTARTLARKCYLHQLETSYRCYRDGEPVTARVQVSNYGLDARRLQLTFVISPVDGGDPVHRVTRPVNLAAGETAVIDAAWKPARFAHTRYRVEAQLAESGAPIDTLENAFEVWKQETIARGTTIASRDNYIHLNGQPVFTQGTDDYVYMFLDRHENPLTMQRDADGCRDACVDIYENLIGGLRGPQQNPPRQWWRWLDAMALSVQRAGGIFMPGMLIFSNTAVSHIDLEEQKAFCNRFAARYKELKGLIYYINGDLELHNPNLPDVQALYRDFLRKQYGTDENLRAAWKTSPPEAPIDRLTIQRGKWEWRDVRTLDDYRFRVTLVQRWLGGLAAAIRAADPNHPITAEFYQSSGSGIDLRLASGALDFANFGYFGNANNDRRRFPAVLKFQDQSLKGKGAHVGEFGVKTHPAWLQATSYLQARPETYEHNYFLEITHTAFGQGAAKIQNWSWKYPADLPFAWGMHYSCDAVPRDVLAYYRNAGILFRGFRPKWHPAPNVMLLPDDSRQSGAANQVHEGLLSALRMLIDARVPLSTLEDTAIDRLPKNAETIFYPLSYAPSDAVIETLEAFVRRGGKLYLSGDISFNTLRERAKTGRLERLCGVAFEEQLKTGLATIPRIRVKPVTAQILSSAPMLLENRLGDGRVLYTPDPVELHAPDGHPDAPAFYATILDRLQVKRDPIEPAAAQLHHYRVETQDAETIHVALNHGETDLPHVELPLAAGPVTFSIPSHRPAVAAFNTQHKIIALEGAGEMRHAGELLLRAEPHLMAIALDRRPLATGASWLLLPMGTGAVEIPNAARWKQPKVLTGTVERGRWRTYETFDPTLSAGALRISIDPDRNLSMLLIVEAGRESEAAALAAERVARPWNIRRNS